MSIDKYRRQAKFAAWYDDPADEQSGIPIKNPFRKYKAPTDRKHDDTNNAEEGQLRHVLSDQADGGQKDRADEFQGTSPTHANTMPFTNSTETRKREVSRPDGPVQEEQDQTLDGKKDSGSTSDTANESGGMYEQGRHASKGSKYIHGITDKLHLKNTGHDEKEETDPSGKKKHKFTAMGQFRATVLNSWINILLIMSPVGIAVYYAHVNPIAVFVINFIAIIPLAAMLSYATEEIALRVGEVLGGLLNASFGNAVELIVSIIALTQGQILIVQTSLIGSMLSNLLLVMGMCFFFGGFNRIEQEFNMTVAQTASSLLFLAVAALLLPTAFQDFSSAPTSKDGVTTKPGVAELSRGTAIMLLIVYACYLFFQLKSHAKMYQAPSAKNKKRDLKKHTRKMKNRLPERMRRKSDSGRSATHESTLEEDKPDEAEIPQLSLTIAIVTLLVSTVLVALNAEYLVDSINAITCGSSGISKNFVGLILLPIVGNAAEHATAVTVAVKDKMDLAIGVAVGSSMQIALLVLPFTVVLGWIIGQDMTLYFDGFQITVLFVAVLLVNYLIQDGKSHWLEGVLLMTLYIIIAVAAWYVAIATWPYEISAYRNLGSILRIPTRMAAPRNKLFTLSRLSLESTRSVPISGTRQHPQSPTSNILAQWAACSIERRSLHGGAILLFRLTDALIRF
jgi:Ca2+:H+ antiporter